MERGRAPGDDRRSHHGTRILNRLYTYHAPGPRYGLVGLVESSILPMMMMMMVTDLMRFSDGDAFLSSTLLASSPGPAEGGRNPRRGLDISPGAAPGPPGRDSAAVDGRDVITPTWSCDV
ncbi:aconitate hydratase [Marssonina coronariae]|uniref:Aconitate hydratase n=1 Tax=Diplocarpon coronariae TaxID=2795749 RepID=A0A218ZA68_9HELO|nr:aconitate hydratase [Marssonina coronariae]